jgi:hypothetical protein
MTLCWFVVTASLEKRNEIATVVLLEDLNKVAVLSTFVYRVIAEDFKYCLLLKTQFMFQNAEEFIDFEFSTHKRLPIARKTE